MAEALLRVSVQGVVWRGEQGWAFGRRQGRGNSVPCDVFYTWHFLVPRASGILFYFLRRVGSFLVPFLSAPVTLFFLEQAAVLVGLSTVHLQNLYCNLQLLESPPLFPFSCGTEPFVLHFYYLVRILWKRHKDSSLKTLDRNNKLVGCPVLSHPCIHVINLTWYFITWLG